MDATFFTDILNNLIHGGNLSALDWAILIVGALIIIVGLVSLTVSIILAIKYIRFNRRQNQAGLTGVDAARKILDQNGLTNIKVSVVGSLLFGNSYSHYFKKVRLRRFTRNKKSISSLAMGAQKASLAILDKEGDPDMKKRIRLIPITFFGPFAFIPLIVIGVLLDLLVFKTEGLITVIFASLGLLLFLFSLLLSIMTLKTEVKAQKKAYDIMSQNGMATESELQDMKELFKLYNIQYVNDIILSALELLYRILIIISKFSGNSSSSSSSN